MTIVKRLSGIILATICVAVVAGVWVQRQQILDWWKLRDYTPSQRVVELADNTSMSDQGRKLFYVHDPQLGDKVTFRANCEVDEASIVLGCYVSHRGIYILDVEDPRLDGVHEVTAAHEMLHAAYDRLGSDERSRIDELVTEFFSSLTDQRLIDIVQKYRDRDPDIVPNELHSILATEVRELTPELEQHYSRYFTDRRSVVTLAEQYEAAFTQRNEQIAAYDAQLTTLKQAIDALTTSLEAQSAAIAEERARIDALLAAERFEEYNAAIPGFNSQVRSYNDDLRVARQRITEYNATIELRNAIAVEERELIEAIDTRSAPQEEE